MPALIERPMGARSAAAAAAAILALGSLDCFSYNALQGRWESPLVGALWAAANLLPWFVAFESAKHRPATPGRVAAILAAAALVSMLLEPALGVAPPPASLPELGFALVRRLPGAGFVLVLLALRPRLAAVAARRTAASEAAIPLLPRQILWVRAAGNYLEFCGPAGPVLRRMTMREAEAALARHGFVRIHRSALVNRGRVARLRPGKLADEVELDDGTVLRVGSAYRPGLKGHWPDRPASRPAG
jgi:hypothetical protein